MFDDDLEENVFKRNIPGKYHRWDKDGDEHEHAEDFNNNDDASDDEDTEEAAEFNIDDPLQRQMNSITTEKLLQDDSIPDELKLSILHERGQKHNTGVKAVLADRKAHKDLERALYNAKKNERDEILNRIAVGAKVPLQNGAISSEFVKGTQYSLSDEEDDDLDDEFMAEFRSKRLAELRATAALPSFGSVREVANDGLLEELESVDPRVFVVVHLYEPGITVNISLLLSLSTACILQL